LYLKRVVHLTSAHSAFDNRIFHKECKGLLAEGYLVSLVAPYHRREVVEGIEIVAVDKSSGLFGRLTKTFWQVLVTSVRLNSDLYHFHDFDLILVGVILKLLFRKKVIYDVHEDYPKLLLSKQYIPKSLRKALSAVVKIMEYLCSVNFDAIIAATDSLSRKFAFHRNCVSVRNFPKLNVFQYSPIERRIRGFTAIYAGTMGKVRGISNLVQAMSLVSHEIEAELVLCGEISPAAYEYELRNLRGYERTRMMGWVDPSLLPQLIFSSDAGLVCFLSEPNHVEAMPNKLFEYMACGLPVVASNFPLWERIISRYNCGITVNPESPSQISEAIEYLHDNPEKCREMGRNGRNAALQFFNWEIEKNKLLSAYMTILN